jgi:ABC-type transport system involved in cytochrome c biogenesis permease subunit
MASRQRLTTVLKKLTLAILVVAIAGSYLLVWIHAGHAHESALSEEQCAVCAWATSLATIGVTAPAIALVRPVCRIVPRPPVVCLPAFFCLSFSVRSPPLGP